MSLGTKVITVVLVVFGAYIAADYAIQRFVVYPSFVTLERDEAVKDLKRCRQALFRENEHLSILCNDWAAWDESYAYIEDRNSEFEEENFVDSSFTDAKLNLVYYVNTAGEVVWGQIRDFDFMTTIALDGFPPDALPPDSPVLDHKSNESSITGIVNTERGPMFVASRPILTSEKEGPIRGSILMGQFLNEEVVDNLVAQTQVNFQVWPMGSEALPADGRRALQRLTPLQAELIEEQGEDLLAVFGTIPDFAGNPALLMRADVPREISDKGAAAMHAATMTLVAAGVLTALILLVVLQHTILRPVGRLTKHATTIGHSSDLTTVLNMDRRDEIGMLAREFDHMVAKLAESRAKLTETSRQAGMAEVASGVLHNVGNVLNSVNVSTSTITKNVHRSKVAGLAKATDLMKEHAEDLGEFITQDERGKHLPLYLNQLSESLLSERQDMLDQLSGLADQIGHMNQVIQAQQDFARAGKHVEPTSMLELAGNALSMMDAAFERHNIQVQRDLAELPTILVDRAKTLQVLVNLLTNAKEALASCPEGTRQLKLELAPVGHDRVVLQVTDTGAGIAPEELSQIFADGYTTKRDGRGHGLHYSALAAKEMGGSLTATSDGAGQGATFRLELPLNPVGQGDHAPASGLPVPAEQQQS